MQLEDKSDHSEASRGSPELLAKKAMGGDPSAFDQLVAIFWGDIFRMIYYRTFSRSDAEDLTQEAFMRAFTKISDLRRFDRLRPWLFKIAVNLVRDFHRKRRLQSLFLASDNSGARDSSEAKLPENPSPLEFLKRKEFWRQVRLFTDSLPRLQREVFLLRFLDHLTISEIAATLNKGESTIKTHLYRAIRKYQGRSSLVELLREEFHEQ